MKNSKDTKLSKQLRKEVLESQRKKQDSMKAAIAAQRKEDADHVKAARREKRSQDAQPYWDKVHQEIDQLMQGGMEAYHEWKSGMAKIVKFCYALVKAIQASGPWDSQVADVIGKGLKGATVGLFGFPIKLAAKGVKAAYQKVKNESVELPGFKDLNQFVTVNDKGELNTSQLMKKIVRDDGQELSEDQKKTIDTGVTLWLKILEQEGDLILQWNKGEAPRVLDTNNNPITKDAFEKLRDDPKIGLNASLEERFGLHFDHSSKLTP